MKIPDHKKPLQVTVSPWEVAFGQKVDADRLIQEDKEWLESRQRLMDARKRDDAKLLAQADKNVPKDVYMSDGRNFITQEQKDRKLQEGLEKGLVAAPVLGAIGASSGSWMGPAAKMLIEGTKSIPAIASMAGVGAGTELLEDKPTPLGALAKAAQWAATTRMPISEVLTYTGDAEAGGLARLASRLAADSAPSRRGVAEVVKEKGGNWLTGSVEDSLSGLKKRMDPELEGYARRGQNLMPHEAADVLPKIAINNFIDKQLTKYVRNDMATPGDPIRALAEKGVLHFEPNDLYSTFHRDHRAAGRMPMEGLATTQLGKGWENVTDGLVRPGSAEDWRANAKPETLATIPGLDRIPDNVNIHEISSKSGLLERTGFEHLIDELSNTINPDSGLPRHLQFPADRLDRVSVPQAVERVSEINVWRKALKVEEDLKRANNAATVLHKEYPDNGMKWVELTSNKDVPAEGYNITPIDAKNGRYWKVEGPGFKYPSSANTEAEAIAMTHKPALADALKYEGDTMGHCVGGYCDDVVSGRSRIYSLRDAKGQPHVTVEVQPMGTTRKAEWDEEPLRRAAEERAWEAKDAGDGREIEEIYDEAYKTLQPEFSTAYTPMDRIIQIKGKQNRAPNPEYLPMVQDFVRSGQWSDVGDFGNTGLKRLSDFGDEPMVQKAREKFGEYVTPQEWDAIMSGKEGFAQGGSIQAKPVKTVQDLQAIINSISERQFHA